MSPHFCPGFAPELWFICTVAAPRIPALILASSGLCKAVATEFLQRAPVLPSSYDVAIETNMALRPPRGHFTDPARQWCSAFTQRFLKAAVTWWKRRSWRSLLVIGGCFVCGTGQKDSSGSSVGWDLRAFTRAVGRGETASWLKKTAKEGWDVLGAMLSADVRVGRTRESEELESVPQSPRLHFFGNQSWEKGFQGHSWWRTTKNASDIWGVCPRFAAVRLTEVPKTDSQCSLACRCCSGGGQIKRNGGLKKRLKGCWSNGGRK